MDLVELFCDVDDFCRTFEPMWNRQRLKATAKKRNRRFTLSLSEVMTIIIAFQDSAYRTFKDYYTQQVIPNLRRYFPQLVSYNRFVELKQAALIPLLYYLHTRKGTVTGISFIDSTPIQVCHPKRANRHKVFEGLAQWGKNSVGWYFGFKLHLVINDKGELLNFKLTPANTDDRQP